MYVVPGMNFLSKDRVRLVVVQGIQPNQVMAYSLGTFGKDNFAKDVEDFVTRNTWAEISWPVVRYAGDKTGYKNVYLLCAEAEAGLSNEFGVVSP